MTEAGVSNREGDQVSGKGDGDGLIVVHLAWSTDRHTCKWSGWPELVDLSHTNAK